MTRRFFLAWNSLLLDTSNLTPSCGVCVCVTARVELFVDQGQRNSLPQLFFFSVPKPHVWVRQIDALKNTRRFLSGAIITRQSAAGTNTGRGSWVGEC